MRTKSVPSLAFPLPGLAATEVANGRRTGRLSLAPGDVNSAPPTGALLAHLAEAGLMGPALGSLGEGHYLVGEGFLQQISFMGCSPHIELTPPSDDSPFCHIRVQGPLPQPILHLGKNAQAPRCPACRGRVDDWRKHSAVWPAQALRDCVLCPRCGSLQRPVDLIWRRSAGAGRLFIHVEDVFPGEAVPVPSLLKGLENISAGAWDYFYVQD